MKETPTETPQSGEEDVDAGNTDKHTTISFYGRACGQHSLLTHNQFLWTCVGATLTDTQVTASLNVDAGIPPISHTHNLCCFGWRN